MEKQVAYGTDWEQVGLDAVLVFELTDSGARFVPKSEHELIRQVIQVQAAVAWRQRDHFRADGPHSWVVDFQEGMLHEGVANAAFAWEKATGFKSREDRYLAALQGMTSTSGQRYIPEEIRDEITTADSALQSAQAASSAASELASKNYVIVDGSVVAADVAEDALNGYADQIEDISSAAGGAGFAASLGKLALAIHEERAFSDKKIQMLTNIQEYSETHEDVSIDPALDGAITRLRRQNENSRQQTKEVLIAWLQEDGIDVAEYTATDLAPRFGSWLVSHSNIASSASSYATSGTAGTALSGASKAAGLVGVFKAGWDLGGWVGGRSATYSSLKRAEFSRMAMLEFRQVRNDVTNRYGDDLSGTGAYAQSESASVYQASEFFRQRSLAEFYLHSYEATQATYFDDIVNEGEQIYNSLFGGNGIYNEQELMKRYADTSMHKASQLKSTRIGDVLANYPDPVDNVQPRANLTVAPAETGTKKPVEFDASESFDTDGSIDEYRWDFDGDGSVDDTTSQPTITHPYRSSGTMEASVTVVDDAGNTATATETVTVATSPTSISVSPSTWDIGQTLSEGTRQLTITVTNTGDVPTDITVNSADGLSVNGVPERLAPGQSSQLTVVLDAGGYDGGPLVVRHDTGKAIVPISVTVVSDDELTRTEDSPMSDEYNCGPFAVDVYGDNEQYCRQSGRTWTDDTVEIHEDHYDGLTEAHLDISFRPASIAKQDDPLKVYVNDHAVAIFESPAPTSSSDNEFVSRTVSVPIEYLEPGNNVVRMDTQGWSSYDIESDFDATRLRYTYFGEPQLNLQTKEFDKEVPVNGIVRVPVVIENNGGRPAEDIVLGTSGGTDQNAVEVVKWPDGFDTDQGGTVPPKQSKVRYFEIRLIQDTVADVEFAARSATDDDSVTISIRPPNDPPTLSTRQVSPRTVSATETIQYLASVTDPDGDAIDLSLEVYDPSDSSWESVETRRISSGEQATWSATPFESNDEGAQTRYRFAYDDGNGHTGVWGPFRGPTVTDDDTSGPTISNVSSPSVIQPEQGATVNATVTDESGLTSVTLNYSTNDREKQSIQMSRSGGTTDSTEWEATIPAPSSEVDRISFEVVATDADESPASSTSVVEMIAVQSNTAPKASAGSNQTADPGTTVELNATKSVDRDGDSLTYRWVQLQGSETPLSDRDSPSPSVTLPDESGTKLIYQVKVTDSKGDYDTDTVTLSVGTSATDPPAIGETSSRDLDGDGLYEDVNGNGELDFGDVELLFNNLTEEAVESNTDAYDFNDNGVVGFGDVVWLFERV